MNNQIKAVLFLIFALLSIYSIFALTMVSSSTYFVAKNGNDNNPGTKVQPWQTITKAANTLVAGETVYVKEGTYNEKITLRNSGSPGKDITFSAYPRNTVTIDGTGLFIEDGLVRILGASNIKLSGFRIINSMYMGVMATSGIENNVLTNITIEKNYISNISSSAIFVEHGKGIIIDENEITKAQTRHNLSKNLIGQETISLINVNGFEIKNNTLYDNNFESIAIKTGSRNGKVHHNDIQPIESAGIYLYAWQSADAVMENIEVFNNRIHNGKASARGIAIASELGGTLRDVKIYNNVIYNNGAQGINIADYEGKTCWGAAIGYYTCKSGPIDNVLITSNTVYNSDIIEGWGGGIDIEHPRATNIFVRNNIVANNRRASIRTLNPNVVIENNLVFGNQNDPNENKGINYIEKDPQFVDPANADFHLKITSPAIGRGLSADAPAMDFDGKSRPLDEKYDIGAFEYSTRP